jgi:hypothetical protein
MSNLKLECLKLAVEYWKGHNVTIEHIKDTSDELYDYCKDEPDIDMKEFERKCSGEWVEAFNGQKK